MDYEKGGTQKNFYSKSEVEDSPCLFCNTWKFKEIYKERGSLGIVRCLKCALIYVNPRLKNPENIYWGNVDKYYIEARLIFEEKSKHHRDPNYTNDLKLIFKYKPSGNFLDVGTNMGFFLRNARNRNWNLFGVEPSPSLSEMARKHFGLNVKTAFLENAGFEDNYYDVVTMTDVFEHIPTPGNALSEVHRILRPDGIILIKGPNGLFTLFTLHLAKITRRLKNYDIFDSYEHVVHYSDKTLRKMLKKYGFKIIKTTIGKPIQIPIWHNYVGQYYQYPSPWVLDPVRRSLRTIFYWMSRLEFWMRWKRVGYLAPNITVITKKI